MSYDEALASRIEALLPDGVAQKKMFGGIAYMDRGNMACGIVDDKLMLRLDKDLVAEYRMEPHTADMDFTGRPMPSMMYVLPHGITDDEQLQMWLDRAFAFSTRLPAK